MPSHNKIAFIPAVVSHRSEKAEQVSEELPRSAARDAAAGAAAAAMASDGKAAEYMAQANKTLKKTSFFSFGGGSQKYEDASDLFEKAGNQYKIAKKCAYTL